MAKTLLEKTKDLVLETTGEFAPADIKLLGSKSVRARAIKQLTENGTLVKIAAGRYILADAEAEEEEEAGKKAKKSKKSKKAKKAKKAKKSEDSGSGFEVFLNGEFLMHCDSEDVVHEQFGHNNNISIQGDKILISSRSGDKGSN